MGYPIFMFLTLGFISGVFLGGGLFCFYQYKLYRLTKFSDKWKPWKGGMIGILGLEIGIIFAVINLFFSVFTTYPELFNVDPIFIPLFLLIYCVLIVSTLGIWWAALGLRNYWKEVLKLAIEAAEKQ